MAAAAASSIQITALKPTLSPARNFSRGSLAKVGTYSQEAPLSRLFPSISSGQYLRRTLTSSPARFDKVITKASSEAGENKLASGLPIDLKVENLLPSGGRIHSRKLVGSVNSLSLSKGKLSGAMVEPEKAVENGLRQKPPSSSNPTQNSRGLP